jgi:hypothetical protein
MRGRRASARTGGAGKSFGAASQGAVAFNRRLLDIAERNVSRGFDLATNLVEAKNLSDAMQVQANYWPKHSMN